MTRKHAGPLHLMVAIETIYIRLLVWPRIYDRLDRLAEQRNRETPLKNKQKLKRYVLLRINSVVSNRRSTSPEMAHKTRRRARVTAT
ncbi:hypothetical protein CEXT_90351 [Caerostris extrusa]|uniref:Uncharacterized protein n=1 Tax=Caerostris extrusa TaxID=172846 RepID=A0AAV4Y5P3_CAEEX|nr:hypothetical protein CEXT_90351 [Caerostris extrusa]